MFFQWLIFGNVWEEGDGEIEKFEAGLCTLPPASGALRPRRLLSGRPKPAQWKVLRLWMICCREALTWQPKAVFG